MTSRTASRQSTARHRLRITRDEHLRVRARGRVLIGGTPTRLLRLSDEGATRVQSWFEGTPVGLDPRSRSLAALLIDRGLAHPLPEPAPVDAGEVAIVIPVKDDQQAVRRLISSLRRHPDTATCQIIVVDDGSQPPLTLVDATAREHPRTIDSQVKLVRLDHSWGPAVARNRGAAEADVPFIAFVDADVVPTAGWLATLCAHFADPDVFAVAPRVVASSGRTLRHRYERVALPLDQGPFPANVAPGAAVSHVPAACLVVRRASDFAFDPELRVGEDVDLVWRIAEAGKAVRYEPRALAYHRVRPSWKAIAHQRFSYGTSAAAIDRRHPEMVAPVIVATAPVGFLATVASGHLGVALAIGAGAIGRLARRLTTTTRSTRPAASLASELAASAVASTAGQLSDAVVGPWFPLQVPLLFSAARGSTRARLALGLIVARAIGRSSAHIRRSYRGRASRQHEPLSPLAVAALGWVDRAVYGAGVWAGCVRDRNFRPLVPRVVGRRKRLRQ